MGPVIQLELSIRDVGDVMIDFGDQYDDSVSITPKYSPWYPEYDKILLQHTNFVIAELLLCEYMELLPSGSFKIGTIPEHLRMGQRERYSPNQMSFRNCVQKCIGEVERCFEESYRTDDSRQSDEFNSGDERILAAKLVTLATAYDDAIMDFQLAVHDTPIADYFDIPIDEIMVISESRNLTLNHPFSNGVLTVSALGLGSKRIVYWPPICEAEDIEPEVLQNLQYQLTCVNLLFDQVNWIMAQLVCSHRRINKHMSCRVRLGEHQWYKCHQRGIERVHINYRSELYEVDFIFSLKPNTPE